MFDIFIFWKKWLAIHWKTWILRLVNRRNFRAKISDVGKRRCIYGWPLWRKVVYVLSTPKPEEVEDASLEQIRRRSKWENDNYICLGHILNGMSDSFFDLYQNHEPSKDLLMHLNPNTFQRMLLVRSSLWVILTITKWFIQDLSWSNIMNS